MSLEQPNTTCRVGPLLESVLTRPEDRIAVLDVGARGGAEAVWAPIRTVTDVFGFDPDPAECDRLNAEARGGDRYLPMALGDRVGRQTMYLTRFPYSSGFRAGRREWMQRFPVSTLEVVGEAEVETTTLDRLSADGAFDHIDFLKIDTEGSEHDVLAAGLGFLRDRRVVGIKTEVWWDPVIKGQKGFAEIDILLREAGFRFFDVKVARYPRATLPAGRLRGVIDPSGLANIHSGLPSGQVLTGDALYFRDPVGERLEGGAASEWDGLRLVRLCALLDVFDYADCAIEVLETFRDRVAPVCDVDRLIDALVPPIDGRAVHYDTYRAMSAKIRMDMNRAKSPTCTWRPGPTGYVRPR
jgi:FkbM family methyltransferase